MFDTFLHTNSTCSAKLILLIWYFTGFQLKRITFASGRKEKENKQSFTHATAPNFSCMCKLQKIYVTIFPSFFPIIINDDDEFSWSSFCLLFLGCHQLFPYCSNFQLKRQTYLDNFLFFLDFFHFVLYFTSSCPCLSFHSLDWSHKNQREVEAQKAMPWSEKCYTFLYPSSYGCNTTMFNIFH